MKKLNKVIINLFLLCSLTGFSQEKTSKKIKGLVDVGFSNSILIFNSTFDRNSSTLLNNSINFSGGILYDINEKYSMKSTIGIKLHFIRQQLYFNSIDLNENDIMIKSRLSSLNLNLGIYRTIVSDSKSSLKIGFGFLPWYFLTKEYTSDDKLVHPNAILLDSTEQSRVVSSPVLKLRNGAYLGMMYKVDYKKMSVGFNVDLSFIPKGEVKYKYYIDNWPSYLNSYSISGPFINFSSFIMF